MAVGDCPSGPVVDDPIQTPSPSRSATPSSTDSSATSASTISSTRSESGSSSAVSSTVVSTSEPSSTASVEPDSEGCISGEVGLCASGNYPIWDPSTNTISCDVDWDDVDDTISDCQRVAEAQYNISVEAISCEESSCSAATRRDLEKRASGTKRKSSSNPQYNGLAGGSCNKKAKVDTFSMGAQAGKCDATFNCDTDLWPNVCNNARSAIEKRGYQSILTWRGMEVHATGPWSASQ